MGGAVYDGTGLLDVPGRVGVFGRDAVPEWLVEFLCNCSPPSLARGSRVPVTGTRCLGLGDPLFEAIARLMDCLCFNRSSVALI